MRSKCAKPAPYTCSTPYSLSLSEYMYIYVYYRHCWLLIAIQCGTCVLCIECVRDAPISICEEQNDQIHIFTHFVLSSRVRWITLTLIHTLTKRNVKVEFFSVKSKKYCAEILVDRMWTLQQQQQKMIQKEQINIKQYLRGAVGFYLDYD